MKILGIDFGERRIGLAHANSEIKMAFPREGIDTKEVDPILHICELIKKERFQKVVLGLPSNPDGSLHEKEKPIRAFSEELRNRTSIEIHFQDEAFSTVRAKEATAHFSKKKKQEDKKSLDSAAASIILQDFLEEHS
jgi:putative Holliday junction resolvase